MPLEGSARHSLFLVVREAVNNAVKHARPSRVWLTVHVKEGRLQIVVEDDGCGVAMERLSGGDADRSGLGNMRRRVEELAGRFVLEKRPEGGTRVTVDVSLAAAATPAVS
jgi:signal transduction histidine kinase